MAPQALAVLVRPPGGAKMRRIVQVRSGCELPGNTLAPQSPQSSSLEAQSFAIRRGRSPCDEVKEWNSGEICRIGGP